jgi:hypothetical protein
VKIVELYQDLSNKELVIPVMVSRMVA